MTWTTEKIGASLLAPGAFTRACPVATLLVRAWLRAQKLAAALETIQG
jgi:hypothetical protein